MNPLTSSIIRSVAASSPSSNWVFSPASYLESMYRLGLCASKDNAKEIASSLGSTVGGLPVEATRFASALKGFNSYNCLLSSANFRDYLVPKILEVLEALGGDVLTYASPDEAIALVNRLVEEKMHGKITGLLSREQVHELTNLIILNCVYFKQPWYYPFDKPYYGEPFNNANGSVTQVGLLKRKERFKYYEGPGYDIVRIPYLETDICCYLIVPTVGTLASIIEGFEHHYANIAKVNYGLDCHVAVPPFKVENTWDDLGKITQQAGICRAFKPTQEWDIYDWARMIGGWAKVDKIIQKTYLDFTYEGTEAAAATAIMMSISGCCFTRESRPIKYIRADKPFLFCLANDNHPETPLFVGVVKQL
jgi:serine protease inhibitor